MCLDVREEEELVAPRAAEEELVDGGEADTLDRGLVLSEVGDGDAAGRVPQLHARLLGGDGGDALLKRGELDRVDGLRVVGLGGDAERGHAPAADAVNKEVATKRSRQHALVAVAECDC